MNDESHTRTDQRKATTTTTPTTPYVQKWVGIFAVLSIILGVVVTSGEDSAAALAEARTQKVIEKAGPSSKQFCESFCQARSAQLKRHHRGADFLSFSDLRKNVEEARDSLLEKMKRDYGNQTFHSMWMLQGKHAGYHAIVGAKEGSNASNARFQRKLQLKVLQVQKSIRNETDTLKGCNCTAISNSTNTNTNTNTWQQKQQTQSKRRLLSRNLQKELMLPQVPSHYARFVWSTGGHSAAAGHGNLFNQSYTSFMEQAIQPIFKSVGIQFEGRNYAMGGMDSAPQLALCNEAVYGVDADVISWDFGMTDGPSHWKSGFYANRAGMHLNRPAHVSLNAFGKSPAGRRDVLVEAEELGIPTLMLDQQVIEKVTDGIPDMFGLTQEQIDTYPKYARNFKCKDQLEKEEPCAADKYTLDYCPKRKRMAQWHPGWHVFAMQGNLIALWLAQSLLDAIKALEDDYGNQDGANAEQIYNKLKSDEDAEYKNILASTIPDQIEGFVSVPMVNKGIKAGYLYRNRSICHTSFIPAETRYQGILTMSENKGISNYDTGIERKKADVTISDDEKNNYSMPLVYDESDREKCEVQLNIDHKDFFFVSQEYGWTSLTFPNDAELAAYAPAGDFKPIGMIVLCFLKCDWGKCQPGEKQHKEFPDGLKFELNGKAVTALEGLDQCFLLHTDEEGFYHQPNPEGRYTLRVLVNETNDKIRSFTRITSLIVV